jgi:hypothetical protein
LVFMRRLASQPITAPMIRVTITLIAPPLRKPVGFEQSAVQS